MVIGLTYGMLDFTWGCSIMIVLSFSGGTVMEKQTFESDGRTATLYKSEEANRPFILLNNYEGDGSFVVEAMEEIGTPACNLLVVGDLKWNHDMTPWYCPPLTENDTPCTGGADDYLNLLLTEIMPRAMQHIEGTPSFTGIAGYSLAGLFAVYATFQSDVFDRVASISGSLWFPDFREYVLSHQMKKQPEKMYFSLGDKEAKTRNRFLKAVLSNTEEIVKHYEQLGINVTWELNPGNHFRDAALRSAKGIKAILE